MTSIFTDPSCSVILHIYLFPKQHFNQNDLIKLDIQLFKQALISEYGNTALNWREHGENFKINIKV